MISTRWSPAILAALLALSPALRADRLTLLDGNSVDAEVTAINAAGELMTDTGKPPAKNIEGLRRVERSPLVKPAANLQAAVLLVSGGVVGAQSLEIKNDVCVIQSAALGKLSLPIQLIRGFVLAPRFNAEGKLVLDDAFASALASPDATQDKLLARADGDVTKLRVVSGLLREMNADDTSFIWDEVARTMPRERVYGLVTATAAAGADLSGACRFWVVDGSMFWAKIKDLNRGTLRLSLLSPGGAPGAAPAAGSDLTLPWSSVMRMEVHSSRMMFISDLKPSQVDTPSLITDPGYRVDRAFKGSPLSLGGRIFEQGIGTHATSRLTFDLDGKYDVFAATIGIDDVVTQDARYKGGGDCEFVVMADGRELLRQRARKSEKPQVVSLNIAGVKRLTLAVEPGEDFEMGDHADWCEARVLKQEK